MEEKVLDLLADLYNEIKEIRNNMATKEDLVGMATKADIANMATKEGLASIKEDVAVMKEDIRRLEGRLVSFENKADSKFNALFDGYKQNTEAIYELRKEVHILKEAVEKHEIKLKIVK